MSAFIVRARTERKSAPLQFSFAISIAVFDTPEEAVTAAQKKFPEWSEFTVIGKAPAKAQANANPAPAKTAQKDIIPALRVAAEKY